MRRASHSRGGLLARPCSHSCAFARSATQENNREKAFSRVTVARARARAWRGTGAGGGHASRALNTLCSHGSAAGRTLLTRVSVPRVAGSRGERRMPSALPALRSTRCRFAELGRLRAARSAAFFPPALAARPGCGASQPAFSARPRAASVLLLRAMRAALACS